jgi:ATP-binding cassette subfamily B (MDR/TAP) protein 1
MALFAIMFGASHAGTASGFGVDVGKAVGAAERIFGIIDYPSEINAIEIEKQGKHVKINSETFTGKVEFRNVWFRYPTRPEDFVLRGLNIKIEP